jgi:hypothetical protein
MIRVVVALASLMFGTSMSFAQSCSGNGCSKITLEKRNDGCMVFRNSGTKPIAISHNVAGVSVGTAYANSVFVLMAGPGQCMTGFGANYTATEQ